MSERREHTRTNTHTYAHIRTHTHTHTYTYAHIHTHSTSFSFPLLTPPSLFFSLKEPTLVKSVKNAELFNINHGDGKTLRILHVYGTPYEMGKAQAEIFGQEIVEMYASFMKYIDQQIEPYINWLPKVRPFLKTSPFLVLCSFHCCCISFSPSSLALPASLRLDSAHLCLSFPCDAFCCDSAGHSRDY